MKAPAEPSQNEIIQSWHERAHAYHLLTERWPIFTDMANRLLEYLPDDFEGHALDLAGGSGLVTKLLLDRYPNARVTVIEPAENMRTLALQRFGNRIVIVDSTSDELEKHNIIADTVLCNASFHLMNEATTLSSVSAVLSKGSSFVVNCWGHSFKEAQSLNHKADWMIYVNRALGEFGLTEISRPSTSTPNIKSTDGLKNIGESCGLRLIETKIVTTEIETKFNIEFAAMSSNFLHDIDKEIRKQVIDRAITLCQGMDRISTVDLCFEKV